MSGQGGAPTLANSAAEVRGQAPPVIPLDDGVQHYDQYLALPFLNPINGGGQDFYRAENLPSRIAGFPIAFTIRAFDKFAAYEMLGDHGDIARIQGTPVGVQLPFGGSNRAVVRPVPNAWDSGYWTDSLQPAVPTQ